MPPRKRAASSSRKSRSGSKSRRTSSRKKQPAGFKAKTKHVIKKIAIAGLAIGFAMLAWILLSLPSVDRLYMQNSNPGIVIYDSNQEIINSYGSVYGRYLKYNEIPKELIEAILATEDRNFFYHAGFDPLGLARAMFANLRAGKVVQGGSTITQQIAKNLFLSSERTYSRKFKELFMAMKLEWYFSKERLLEIYVNRVYLGAGTFGIDAASHRYFGKSATKIDLAEAALLTGLLKAPSRFAPTSSPKRAQSRARQILINMQDAGYIDEKKRKTAETALSDYVEKKAPPSSNTYYYTDWIIEEIPRHIGEVTEDVVVETTMDKRMQKLAEEVLQAAINNDAKSKKAKQASLLAMEPNGAVKAMMGGVSYSESQYNRAVQSERQPGSAFKLFVYLSAFEQGAYPNMQVSDQPVSIGKWQPRNYGGDYKGVMSLRSAVAQSINTVAVQISEMYGRGNIIAMARSLGVTSRMDPVPSLALGAYEMTLMEMVTAFAHLASEGLAVQPYGITKIMNKQGDVLYERKEQVPARILSQRVVAMANDVFSTVINSGTATRARLSRPAAGKTGTTSDYKDAWFIGYTPQLAAGVWVGNDEAVSMQKVTGGNIPASIWHDFMEQAMEGKEVRQLPMVVSTPSSDNLPWQNGGGRQNQPNDNSVGGRHLPWNNNKENYEQPRYDRKETKEFWDSIGL